jgi:hypothetical protein
MKEKELGNAELIRLCEAVSPGHEPCEYLATVHCGTCDRWFCDGHIEEEEWHSCALPPGEEGGES